MSQHHLKDSRGREWMVGFDNPSGGFFATRFLSDEEAERTGEEADILIGFGRGVELWDLVVGCARHGLILDNDMFERLRLDAERERRPITPLQSQIRQIAIELGVWDD